MIKKGLSTVLLMGWMLMTSLVASTSVFVLPKEFLYSDSFDFMQKVQKLGLCF